MRRRQLFLALLLCAPLATQEVAYTLRIADREERLAAVEAVFPTGGKPVVELFLPVWSPGFYRVENYHEQLRDLTARAADAATLAVEHDQPNRWKITTGGAAAITVSYHLHCNRASVTHNQITDDFAVFCGPATFVTEVGELGRRHRVRIELPKEWPQAVTGMAPAGEDTPNSYAAPDYDRFVDAPIVCGTFRTEVFDVLGARHELACFGAIGQWDARAAAAKLKPIATELCRTFGAVPFTRYVFLAGFRNANGGLEHLDSTLLSVHARMAPDDPGFLSFVAHEYAHAFNVKRLRPVELGPFDYEHPPQTASLWIAEGLTTWFGDLALARAGAVTQDQWLGLAAEQIRRLQGSPGRKRQTLAEASSSVWKGSQSGVGGDPRTTISYYVKGPVVGFALDARLRTASAGKHGLDDLMKLAYERWSGAKGFTPEQFEAAAAELAGNDQQAFFDRALRSTDELDYAETLAWFGLRFRPAADDAPREQRWVLEVLPDATQEQQDHLRELLAPRLAR